MAKLDLKTIIQAALLTLAIFVSIYFLNLMMESEREKTINNKMNEIISDFEEIETTYYLMEYMGEEQKLRNRTCEAMKKELEYLESKLWKLDMKIRDYREITKDFINDEFYIREKAHLNRREIIHFTMLEKMRDRCDYNHLIILYFYGECDVNKRCDDQGFVLTYINQLIDPEISIFSFDMDLGLSSVNALAEIHNISELPCVVVEGVSYCGMHNKAEMVDIICEHSNISICTSKDIILNETI
ncbi:MAG: hypothetical protein B6U97_03880 [Candidatus Altiarchaeales archaeon ex4484_96]|nr:MAG: hypothetical protein B6U97_03880 [Candidatus Altiarchaeales archaeon ex4484_96]